MATYDLLILLLLAPALWWLMAMVRAVTNARARAEAKSGGDLIA